MTFVAVVGLPEAVAQTVAARIGEDDRLSAVSVDLHAATDDRWQVSVYFEENPDANERDRLADALRSAGANGQFAIDRLPETDWVAKSLQALAPVRAARFLVHGHHDRTRVMPNDLAIEIEAGLAFGTGHHGTTTGCLMAIDRVAKCHPIANALDIGTGSGVLAIAIAKRTKAGVMASDIDPVAVAVARENVRLNRVASRVRTIVADGLGSRPIRDRAPYDLIVANILAGPLVMMAPAIHRNVASGGTVILSGLLTTQARRIAAIYRGQCLRRTGSIVIGEWVTLIFRR